MATDVLVTIGTFRDRVTGAQVRRVNEVVATGDRAGQFVPLSATVPAFGTPVLRRVLASSMMSEREIADDIAARALLKSFLAAMGGKYGEEYCGPEWNGAVNEFVVKAAGRSPAEILQAFKAKFRAQTEHDPEGAV